MTGDFHAGTCGRSSRCCSKFRIARSSVRCKRVRREREKYRAYLAKYKKKPLYYRGREKWTEIPKEFL